MACLSSFEIKVNIGKFRLWVRIVMFFFLCYFILKMYNKLQKSFKETTVFSSENWTVY